MPRLDRIALGARVCASAFVPCVLAALAVGGTARPAIAQTESLVRLNCTAGSNYPSCSGWGPWGPNQYHTARVVAGAGPTGQSVVQFDQIPSGSHAQYYLGFSNNSGASTPHGTVRYIRFRFKARSPINLSGTGDVWGSKFIILGDGSDSSSRVICNLRDNGRSVQSMAINCARNIDGYPNGTQLLELPADAWQHIQIEVRSSTSSGAGNGRIALWANNNSYSSPTRVSGSFQLNTTNWQNVNVGFYAGTTLAQGGNASFQIADFEMGNQWHSSWSSGTSFPTPVPPSNVRILSSAAAFMPIAMLLTWSVTRRRPSR